MRSIFLVAALITGTCSLPIWAQETGIVWERTFGGPEWDEAFCVQQTSDEGYVLAGYRTDQDDNKGMWVIKTDMEGDILWDRVISGRYPEQFYSVQQTSDGGYILAGRSDSWGEGTFVNGNLYFCKMDEEGNKGRGMVLGGGDNEDGAYSIQETQDGGYIVAGYTGTYGAGGYDVWLIKADAECNILWDKTFGGERDDSAWCVRQTPDGGYILTGSTESYGNGNQDAWLIKTDADGDALWTKTFGGPEWDGASCVQQTSDEGYVLAGVYQHGPAGAFEPEFFRVIQSGILGAFR